MYKSILIVKNQKDGSENWPVSNFLETKERHTRKLLKNENKIAFLQHNVPLIHQKNSNGLFQI
jgi:hypothetical protein